MKKAARWIDQKRWLSAITFPMLVGIPPALVAACDFYPRLRDWFGHHPLVQSVLILWPLFLIPANMFWKKLTVPVSVSVTQLSVFLRVLSHIVGKKVERFQSFREKHQKKKSIAPKNIFNAITQPDDQLREIIEGIWKYFELTKGESTIEIKVVLGRMSTDYLLKFECYYPANKGMRCQLSELQQPDCGFSKAKSLGRILVLEDTDAESNKPKNERCFIPLSEELQKEEQSAILFPIKESNGSQNIDFVLSICASKPMHFRTDNTDAYSLILEHFAQRILLEIYLRDIKVKSRN